MQIPAFSSATPHESASVRKRWSPFDHDLVERIALLSSRYSEVLTFPAGGYHSQWLPRIEGGLPPDVFPTGGTRSRVRRTGVHVIGRRADPGSLAEPDRLAPAQEGQGRDGRRCRRRDR